MDRREAIKRTSLAMGGMLSASTLAVIMKGCSPSRSLEWAPTLFTPEQAMVIEDICERIIPATDTPGAKGVGVPQFVEEMVNMIYQPDARQRFMDGLSGFMATVQEERQSDFTELTEEEQYDILNPLNEAVVAEVKQRDRSRKPSFFRSLKELTVTGYYTSEIGATEELQFLQIPGNYDGCISLEEAGGKTWASLR